MNAVPTHLSDIEQTRLDRLSEQISKIARSAGHLEPVHLYVDRRLDPMSYKIFNTSTHSFDSIAIQDHWLMQPSDIPDTDEPELLKQWFSTFTRFPLRKIDDRFYEQVVSPVIQLVRSADFEDIRDSVLANEVGHIVQDGPLFKSMVLKAKVSKVVMRILGLAPFASVLLSWLIFVNPQIYAIFSAVLALCIVIHSLIPKARIEDFSDQEKRDNELNADRFAAKTAPEKSSSYADYLSWRLFLNREIKNSVLTPPEIKAQYTETGEIVDDTTHPTYAKRVECLNHQGRA